MFTARRVCVSAWVGGCVHVCLCLCTRVAFSHEREKTGREARCRWYEAALRPDDAVRHYMDAGRLRSTEYCVDVRPYDRMDGVGAVFLTHHPSSMFPCTILSLSCNAHGRGTFLRANPRPDAESITLSLPGTRHLQKPSVQDYPHQHMYMYGIYRQFGEWWRGGPNTNTVRARMEGGRGVFFCM